MVGWGSRIWRLISSASLLCGCRYKERGKEERIKIQACTYCHFRKENRHIFFASFNYARYLTKKLRKKELRFFPSYLVGDVRFFFTSVNYARMDVRSPPSYSTGQFEIFFTSAYDGWMPFGRRYTHGIAQRQTDGPILDCCTKTVSIFSLFSCER